MPPSHSHRRRALLAAAAAAALATTSAVPAVQAYSGSAGAASACPFAKLAAFSEKVSTAAGRRALLAADKDKPSSFSANPSLEPAKLFMKLGHEATLDFAKSLPQSPAIESPIDQAASGLSEPSERDHSHGLTDAFVDAYVAAALAAHGLDFAEAAAADPVMSQRPGVKKLLQLAKKKKAEAKEESEMETSEEEEAAEDEEEEAASDDDEKESSSSSSSSLKEAAEGLLADAETTERATKEFQRAHRRALAGFLLPTTPPFSNYSASLGNSSTGVTAPKLSPILNVSSAGTITVAEALKYPGPNNATRFESTWLSELRTRGANIRTTFLEEDHVMRVAEAVFRAVSNPINNGLMLRIAFHECGTFDYRGPPGRKGGCNGSIRYEFDWVSNGGIQRFGYPFMWAGREIANAILGAGTISFADAAVIIGAAGVANAGGPWVNVGYGRPDVTEEDIKTGVSANTEVEKDFELPELLAEWQRFGFGADILCILSGAHSFGISATSSPQGLLNTPVFSNKYYKNIEAGVAFFTSDKALIGPETLDCVRKAAVSQDWFFNEWSEYYFVMSSWGVTTPLKGVPVKSGRK